MPLDHFQSDEPSDFLADCATVCRAPRPMSLAMFAALAFAALAGCGAAVTPGGDGGNDVVTTDVQARDVFTADESVDATGCILPNGTVCPVGQHCPVGPCSLCTCNPGGTLTCVSGDCDASLGCGSDADCGLNESCVFANAGCGLRGVCEPSPECDPPQTFCSCDGTTTFGCVANAPWLHTGPCETPDASVTSCFSTTDCPSGQVCGFDSAGCGIAGRCEVPAPCGFAASYCGCDGVTFTACVPTSPYQFVGTCEGPDAGPIGCSTEADCSGGQVCAFDAAGCGVQGQCETPPPCDILRQFCGCDGVTHANSCVANEPYQYVGPCMAADAGAGCATSADCSGGQTCLFTAAGCGVLGTCSYPPECPVLREFCGCDGVTFGDCVATRPYLYAGFCEGTVDAGTGGTYDCDPTTAVCNSLEPSCPYGEVSPVVNGCWGSCVPFDQCAPIACEPGLTGGDPHCPLGTYCDPVSRACIVAAPADV